MRIQPEYMSFKKRCTISSSLEFPARNSNIPKEDGVFPRMLYCDSRCSQMLPGLFPALPGALLCNMTRHLGDEKRVILRLSVPGSVRAIRAVRKTRVFQTETRVVADGLSSSSSPSIRTRDPLHGETAVCNSAQFNVQWIDRVRGFWIDQYNHWWNWVRHIEEKMQVWNYNSKQAKKFDIWQFDSTYSSVHQVIGHVLTLTPRWYSLL
jgi:hypothetical protein